MSYASPMHDIGKIGIPDNILLKPGKLADEEFEKMKSHTLIGAKILSNSHSDF
jgi:putative two-component system response regulator